MVAGEVGQEEEPVSYLLGLCHCEQLWLHPAAVLRDCGEGTSDLSSQVPKERNVCVSANVSSLAVGSLNILSLCICQNI